MGYTVLYNPLAGNGSGDAEVRKLDKIFSGSEITYKDITAIEDYEAFFTCLPSDEVLVISGGDGTLNHFVNAANGITFDNEVYYYATGSGNDFLNDIGKHKGDAPFDFARYMQDLPTATVKGKEYKFLNGIGFGIDGYCCEESDRQRAVSDKPINYTMIALKGLLFHYKPTVATVTVDGVTKTYKKVWLSPSMNGRFYGGGMMIAPDQDRLGQDRRVSVVVAHDLSKLKCLLIFPGIFKGKHIKYKKNVEIIKGNEVTVRFDRPCALQIDGETILDVIEYSVKTGVNAGNGGLKKVGVAGEADARLKVGVSVISPEDQAAVPQA